MCMSCNKAKVSASYSNGKVKSAKVRQSGAHSFGQPKVRISFGAKKRGS